MVNLLARMALWFQPAESVVYFGHVWFDSMLTNANENLVKLLDSKCTGHENLVILHYANINTVFGEASSFRWARFECYLLE